MAKAITEVATATIGAAIGEARTQRAKTLRATRERRAQTLGEFWELTHLPSLSTGRPGTKKQHSYRYTQWIKPYLGNVPWRSLTATRLAEWLATIQKAPMRGPLGGPTKRLSSQSIINIYSTLSAILTHAVAIGLLHSSPAGPARRYLPKFTPSEVSQKRERALTFEQARTLITSPRLTLWTRTEILFAILCCTRRGETHGLQWKNVHWKGTLREPTPHVRIERSHDGPTKTDSSTRSIPLHPDLARVLEDYRAKEWTRRFKREPKPDDYVFPSSDGMMRGKNSSSRMKRIAKMAGIPRITFHSLRHTGATLYRANGMRREDVAALLGHTGTITDLYAPPTLPLLMQEIQRLRLIDDPAPAASEPVEVDQSRESDPCTQDAPPLDQKSAKTQGMAKTGGSVLDLTMQPVLSFSPMPQPSAQIGGADAQDINPDNPRPRPARVQTSAATIIAQSPGPIAGYGADELSARIPDTDRAPAASDDEPCTYEEWADRLRGNVG